MSKLVSTKCLSSLYYLLILENISNLRIIMSKKIFSNVSSNHFHQQNTKRSILTPFVIVLTWCILRSVWACVELNVTPGHGFSFGSRSAYVRGKSMYGIFLLWKIILLTFISFLHFLSFGKNMLGHTHNNGNPASCSLCFWHRG